MSCGKWSLTPGDVALFDRLAAAVVFTNPGLRQPEAVAANRLGQPGLWPHAISGDLPIVLVRVGAAGDESVVRQLLEWHAHARRRGLELDLVILDERDGEAAQQLRTELQSGAASARSASRGASSCWPRIGVSADDAVLLAAAARAVLRRWMRVAGRSARPSSYRGRPRCRRCRRHADRNRGCRRAPPRSPKDCCSGTARRIHRRGREYVIKIDGTRPGGPALPPAPWTNVLANPGFGCLVTEAGLGYTWAGNSQMNRLTPWSNDPVSDPPGEVLYLRDEETGEFWTPTPLPCGAARLTVRHGQGYHSLQPTQPQAGTGCAGAGPAGRSGQAGRASPCGTPATGRAACRRRSMPSGCSALSVKTLLAGRVPARSRKPARRSPAMPGRATSPGRSLSRPWARRSHALPPRTAPNSWAATVRREAPAALGRAGLSGRAG